MLCSFSSFSSGGIIIVFSFSIEIFAVIFVVMFVVIFEKEVMLLLSVIVVIPEFVNYRNQRNNKRRDELLGYTKLCQLKLQSRLQKLQCCYLEYFAPLQV